MWTDQDSSEDISTPSTCVLYSEDRSKDGCGAKAKSDLTIHDNPHFSKCDDGNLSDGIDLDKIVDYTCKVDSKCKCKTDFSKSVASRKSEVSRFTETVSRVSDVTSKRLAGRMNLMVLKKSDLSCDFNGAAGEDGDDDEDETNRLIQLRNADYMDIVDENLKLVIALAGYPKTKMRLKQMEIFQRSINDIMEMQLKAGLLKKSPVFIDYYLNRGAIVCICKDVDTRDWMVRVSPGLQERMTNNLILLKAKVRRLCIGLMKIPQSCWPSSARDAFKLIQYFNPSLNTHLWKIYAQKIINDVECSTFLIDRVSGEILRGPMFKNVIDYSQMDFEITGYTEIYYDCFLSDMGEDLRSVASRVKLLDELKSDDTTPRVETQRRVDDGVTNTESNQVDEGKEDDLNDNERVDSAIEMEAEDNEVISESKEEFVDVVENDSKSKSANIKTVETIGKEDTKGLGCGFEVSEKTELSSAQAMSEKSESVYGSSDNLTISRNSNLNIDSNRGIAYHRRTNYLHVENELKTAVTLEGYPREKLEGSHIRRLKHLFKEYVHKDMKNHRFDSMIIPKFQDVYLSNGAVIYICDSLETKDYLIEVLPKFINSTGLKLVFRDMHDLLRFTRLVMRLPTELAHVESSQILCKLKERYPNLRPDCWKYYSDVAGKQKRQFGVDPDSLAVIKSADFDPSYENETLVFRIIDRQKRDVSCAESSANNSNMSVEDAQRKKLRENAIRMLYCPLEPGISNSPLTHMRANHYSQCVPDDLKLYVGPTNYPESRIDEVLFQTIQRCIEDVFVEVSETGADSPRIHDLYLFDGVIFVICKNPASRVWIENVLPAVNARIEVNLKATEFRGAVGIVTMSIIDIGKDPEEVIETLQKQNPRLRTKYWRKINVERTCGKLEVVLQIDKLSAQVILSKGFNGKINSEHVTFKLGHLKSLIGAKLNLDVHICPSDKTLVYGKNEAKNNAKDRTTPGENVPCANEDKVDANSTSKDVANVKSRSEIFYTSHCDVKEAGGDVSEHSYCKMTLRVPQAILPESGDALDMILDLLQDKNPGINTELWKLVGSYNKNKGSFKMVIDKRSANVIMSEAFDPNIGGERLRFQF